MRKETYNELEKHHGPFEKQTSFITTIIAVKDLPSSYEDYPQLIPIIITQNETDNYPTGQYPILDKGRTFPIGQAVEITPIVNKHPSGGGITFFDIEPLQLRK